MTHGKAAVPFPDQSSQSSQRGLPCRTGFFAHFRDQTTPAHWITDNGRTQAVPRPAQGFRFYRPPLLLSRPPAAARMGDRGTFCEAPAPSLWHFDAGTPQEQQNIQKKCAGTTLWAICGQMRSCAPKAGTCSGCGLFVHRARRRSCTGIFFLQLRAEIEKNAVIHRNGRASIYYHY